MLEVWESITSRFPVSALAEEVRLSVVTARELAKGRPLGLETLSSVWGLPVERAEQILEAAKDRTVEVNDEGQLVGAAGLSLRETDHEIWVGERRLYAWCSWDALFLPAYLDSVATVWSADPISGAKITVEVAPTEIISLDPAPTVISALVPDLDSKEGIQAGPGSERCTSMRFFTDVDSANTWIADRDRIVTLSPTQALNVAHKTWLGLIDMH